MTYANSVILQGTIVSIRKFARGSSVQIATDGGSKRGRNRRREGGTDSDFPVITFPQNVDISSFNIRDMVRISAKAGTRYDRSGGDSGRFLVTIEGTKIDLADRLLAKYNRDLIGTEGGRPDDANIVVVRGRISNIFNPNAKSGVVVISVRTDESDRSQVARISCYQRQAEAAKQAKVGDEVMIAGAVRTYDTTDSRGNTEMWILCRDIELFGSEESAED